MTTHAPGGAPAQAMDDHVSGVIAQAIKDASKPPVLDGSTKVTTRWGVIAVLVAAAATAAGLWARLEHRIDEQAERIDRHVGAPDLHRDPKQALVDAEARGALNETLRTIRIQLTEVQGEVRAIRDEMTDRRRR